MSWRSGFYLLLGAIVPLGCDVPVRHLDTGGVSLPGAGGDGGAAAVAACARGFVVVSSDYQSSNVSLLDPRGEVLSASFLSSASSTAGLSAPLSGDVVLPSQTASGERVALLDRYPAGVLTWVDLRTADVVAQLSVATGFASNPHDYVELSPAKAYVPRFGLNPDPGREPFDAGNDVLIVDPSVPKVTGSIDLEPILDGEAPSFLPRPDRALALDHRVVVLLGGFRPDFVQTAASRLVVIDTATDRIAQTVVLDGYHACSSLALSPDRTEIAVGCSGEWGGDSRPDIATSGVVRVDVGDELRVAHHHPATELGEGPVAAGLSYESARHLVVTTFGRFEGEGAPAADDTLTELDLVTGEHRVVLRSAGEPFTLGDVRCDAVCGVCFLTDAGRQGGVVHRFVVDEGGLTEHRSIHVQDAIGLPPRSLGGF